jgi:hypothetical protein
LHSLQLLRVCPSAEELVQEFNNPGDLDAILNFLGSIEMEKLQCINFFGSKINGKINGEQLAKLVLEIVPRLPNVKELYFFSDCTFRVHIVGTIKVSKNFGRAGSIFYTTRL